MVVVEKDPSLYPIVVTHGRDADYPIHIVTPDGIAQRASRVPITLVPAPRAVAPRNR
jgi:hypothetical protein